MKRGFALFLFVGLMLAGCVNAQYGFLTTAPSKERLPALWTYCFDNFISDKDSLATDRFLHGVETVADSLGDGQLKKYARYFRLCSRILFSVHHDQNFAKGDYESPVAIFKRARAWALQERHADIAAACEHQIGQMYFNAARYGLAFEHLIKADNAFRRLGYQNVPGIAIYLNDIGLNYYQFEEWNKALHYFLAASHYPFYASWAELNTFNAIGLIYAKQGAWKKAAHFYRETADRANRKDTTWIGIASGSLGNVFLATGQYDSALFYHRRNWHINNYYLNPQGRAPEDAAKSGLVMATLFIRQQQWDSVLHYMREGKKLAVQFMRDSADLLDYKQRLLTVQIEFTRAKGDYRAALRFSDSLAIVKDSLEQLLDDKIVNRATEKAEAERYGAEIKLLESERARSRLRMYLMIAALLFIIITGALLFNRFRMGKQRQSERAQKEKELLELEKKRAEEKLQHAEELLAAYLDTIREKTGLIEDMDAELHRLKESSTSDANLQALAGNMEKLLSATILTDNDWQHFRGLFEQVHPRFLSRLMAKLPALSPAEIRLIILTKLNLSSREMANMLGISTDAIRKSRYRLRKKLSLDGETALEEAIGDV